MNDASGSTLLQSPLTDPLKLDGFAANTNSESALRDGAKRDRCVWSGDLAVSAPTLYCTSAASDAVAGSLRIRGSYQRSSGEFPGNLPDLGSFKVRARGTTDPPWLQTWLIEPQPGDLSWAEGKVPAPSGPIVVRWQKSPRGLRLEINVPNGTSG